MSCFCHFAHLSPTLSKRKSFLPVKREKKKVKKLGHLYRHCTSAILSSCVTRSVNNSRQVIQIPVNKS